MTGHYLDNSATTPVLPQAAQKALALMTEEFGNPSSLHALGGRAREALDAARAQVAAALGAQPEEIVFTSGGTESNNLAILGGATALRRRGDHIVTTAIEHESVLRAVTWLEEEGFRVTRLSPDARGHLDPETVAAAIEEKTVLVSLMLVNNEVGSILPVEAAARAIRRRRAPALLHVDAVQAFGKLAFTPARLGADLLTVSGHKIHAPKGSGALYIRRGVHLSPRALGGGQEKGLRSGTEALPALGAFGVAAAALPSPRETLPTVTALRDRLIAGLTALPGVAVNSPEDALPYVVNFSAGRVKAQTMLNFLSERQVYVSAGSACGKAAPSHVLTAMGLPPERIASALRVSFSRFSTPEDVDTLLEALQEGLATLAHE